MANRDLDEWLWQIGAELQKISESYGPGGAKFARGLAWEPRIDLFESTSELTLLVELPGVKVEHIRISYNSEDNQLVVRGLREQPRVPQGKALQLEIYYGEFEREITLPEGGIDIDNAAAKLNAGVLSVTLPKQSAAPAVSVRRVIAIRY